MNKTKRKQKTEKIKKKLQALEDQGVNIKDLQGELEFTGVEEEECVEIDCTDEGEVEVSIKDKDDKEQQQADPEEVLLDSLGESDAQELMDTVGKENLALKDGRMAIQDSLSLHYSNLSKLPGRLIVEGDLKIEGEQGGLNRLPGDLTVEGDLQLKESELDELPRNLTVRGDLDCYHENFESLPGNCTVKGSIDLSYCSSFERLPSDMENFDGDLNLAYTNVKELPRNLQTVNGSLNIQESKVGDLPAGLTVTGDFNAKGTTVWDPDGLEVMGETKGNIE